MPARPRAGGGSRAAGAGGQSAIQAVQVSLGFERSHPKVWDFFREKGLLVVAGSSSRSDLAPTSRLKFLEGGRRVIAYYPKSQGGSGVVGIGTIAGPWVEFERGGTFTADALGDQYCELMLGIYGDASNKPAKPATCYNRQFKRHRQRMASTGHSHATTTWEFGQRCWASRRAWKTFRAGDGDCILARVPVRWEAAVPFESGLMRIDWAAKGLAEFRLAQLSSVGPRSLTHAHWAALRTRLLTTAKAKPAARDAAGQKRKAPESTAAATKAREGAKSACKKATKATKASKARESTTAAAKATRAREGIRAVTDRPKLQRERAPEPVLPTVGTAAADQTLAKLLASLALSKYLPLLVREEVDLAALRLLSEADLVALGLPLGPRRKLQAALKAIY